MRWTVYMSEQIFEDATPVGSTGWFEVEEDSWERAIELYQWCMANGIEVEIADNEYDVTLKNDEWN